MNANVIILAAAAVFLTACDVTPEGNGNKQEKVSAAATAIYIPGGAGLDFGIEAKASKTYRNAKGKTVKTVDYEMDAKCAALEGSIAEILEKEKYKKKLLESSEKSFKVMYRKKVESPVVFSCKETAREGFEKVTAVNIWWYL